jgi:hypothetical protein
MQYGPLHADCFLIQGRGRGRASGQGAEASGGAVSGRGRGRGRVSAKAAAANAVAAEEGGAMSGAAARPARGRGSGRGSGRGGGRSGRGAATAPTAAAAPAPVAVVQAAVSPGQDAPSEEKCEGASPVKLEAPEAVPAAAASSGARRLSGKGAASDGGGAAASAAAGNAAAAAAPKLVPKLGGMGGVSRCITSRTPLVARQPAVVASGGESAAGEPWRRADIRVSGRLMSDSACHPVCWPVPADMSPRHRHANAIALPDLLMCSSPAAPKAPVAAAAACPKLGLSRSSLASPPAAGGSAGLGGGAAAVGGLGGAVKYRVPGLRRPGGFKPPTFVNKQE